MPISRSLGCELFIAHFTNVLAIDCAIIEAHVKRTLR